MKLKNNLENIDFIGDNHIGTSSETPIRPDAFELSSDEKINIIKDDVKHIMETLGLDLSDDSLKGTPNRVAKMFVNEIFGGLDPANKPKASTFDNKYQYGEMLVEKTLRSTLLVSIISSQLLEEHMLRISLTGQLLGFQK